MSEEEQSPKQEQEKSSSGFTSFWNELKRRKVVRVAIVYAVVAWLLAQVAVTVFPHAGLPDWTPGFVIWILIIGFPIALIFAWAFELTPDGIKTTSSTDEGRGDTAVSKNHQRKRNWFSVIVAAALPTVIFGFLALFFFIRGGEGDGNWVYEEAIPEIERLIEIGDFEAAFTLAQQVEVEDPDNPALLEKWRDISRTTTIQTKPEGATVYRRPYNASDDAWEKLGTTPLQDIRVPRGISLIRVELEGYVPLLRALDQTRIRPRTRRPAAVMQLDSETSLPKGMIRIPGWQEKIDGEMIQFRDYFLSKYEVTNAEFKTFVNAGGYQRRDLWEYPFVDINETVSWEAAMERFVDKTSRPGPSTWEGGGYPSGKADYPVGGVNWYEAAAYAKFVGQELPTVYHWRYAVNDDIAWATLPESNLAGSAPAPVGEFRGINWSGTYDMTGNVREWTFNDIGNQKIILGGSWRDPYYQGIVSQGASAYGQNPMDRSETNGFRVAITRDPEIERARLPIKPADHIPNWESEVPVSDEIFEAHQRIYQYDKLPLNEEIVETTTTPNRTVERITFDAAYGEDRVVLYLYLPSNASPPYQVIVRWPNASALAQNSHRVPFADFLLNSGRAVAFPILSDTYERRDGQPLPDRNSTAFRDLTVRWVKDMRRTLDYLETRVDVDTNEFVFFGTSWGAASGPNVLAVESRFRVAILLVGGMLSGGAEVFQAGRDLPEVYTFNALPRVTLPTLLFNGELDSIVPLETSAKPFFQMLGTPDADKKHVIAPGGHFVPRVVLIEETLNWLNNYLGPVK